MIKIGCKFLGWMPFFLLLWLVSPAWGGGAYYEGKTVTIWVDSTPGGGTDRTARVTAQFLPKYLPGNPDIIVQNRPSRLTTMNAFIRRAKPDGLTILQSSSSALGDYARKAKGVKYNPNEFQIIGNILRGGSVVVIRKEALPRLKDPNAEPVVVGALSGERTWQAINLWGAEQLGWNLKWVIGFPGTPALAQAFRRGEVDIFGTSNAPILQPILDEGIAQPLAVLASSRRSDFPDVPPVLEMLGDKKPTGLSLKAFYAWAGAGLVDKWLSAPPDTPKDVVQTLRTAFRKATEDPEFDKLFKKSVSEAWVATVGEESQQLVREVTDIPEAARKKLNDIRRKYNLPIAAGG